MFVSLVAVASNKFVLLRFCQAEKLIELLKNFAGRML